MSKDLHNNERYLRELADKYEPVPPPIVWDEIEQVLDEDKGKRRLFPMLWIFGILLIGAIFLINFKGKQDQEIPLAAKETIYGDYQKESTLNAFNRKVEDTNTANDIEQAKSDNNSEFFNSLEKEKNSNISETVSSVIDEHQGEEVNDENLNSFKRQERNENHLNTSNADKSFETKANPNTSTNAKVNPNTNIKASTNTSKNTNAKTYTSESSNTNTSSKINNSLSSSPAHSDQREIIANEDVFVSEMMSPSTETVSEERPIIDVTALQKLNWMRIPFETDLPLLDPNKSWIDISNLKSQNNSLLAKSWFVELGGGIGRNLSDPVLIDPEQESFRLNTESSWYSWSTSFQLGYQFDNLWYATIGLDLNQTKNKFDFWRRDISSLSVNATQGVQVSKTDFFSLGEIRYTFADVGLSVGRRVSINKWHFSVEGGPIFNMLFNSNGKVQVGEFEFSRLEDQEAYFNTKVGIGGRLAAMLDYPISEQMWISLGPVYHQYFNPLSSSQNPLEERNAILQVKARMRYHF